MKTRDINWTWENSKGDYQGFWQAGQPLSADLLNENPLMLKSKQAFEAGAAALFAPLRIAQPKTWAMLMQHAEMLQVVQDKVYPRLVDIILISDQLVIFIEAFNSGDDLEDWDEIYASLPEFMHGYYQNFNGMHASYECLKPPFVAFNLPAHVSKWTRVNDYRKDKKIPKKQLSRMEKELGDLENVGIIINTEWQDLVLINRNQHDRKLYVVPEGKFDQYFELQDPATKIDALCAHVLSGSVEPFYLRTES